MRYMVTGGAGFIGTHTVEALRSKGSDVVVFDDFSTASKLYTPHGVTEHRASILDEQALQRAMVGIDYVIHLAGRPSVQRSIEDPHLTNLVNVTGTLNVLMAAREAKVRRVVQASSSSVYGDQNGAIQRTETDVPQPLSPYAVSKLAAERYGVAFTHSMGLDVVGMRFFNVFGPGQNPKGAYAAVIPAFITGILRGTPLTIYGDGRQSRDFCYVANIVHALLAACTAPADEVRGQVFNLACGQRTSLNALVTLLSTIQLEKGLSFPGSLYVAARPGDVRHTLATIDKAQAAFGYTASIDIDEGLKRTWDWYEETL
jgi:nucleoside-diphosphate-sugar epimerase